MEYFCSHCGKPLSKSGVKKGELAYWCNNPLCSLVYMYKYPHNLNLLFKVGDSVKEKEGIDDSISDLIGRIVRIDKGKKFPYVVKFPHRHTVGYKEDELIKVSSEPKSKKQLLYADFWKVKDGY